MNWMYQQMKPLVIRATIALVSAIALIFITDFGASIGVEQEMVKILGTIIFFVVYSAYLTKTYISIYNEFKLTMKAFGEKKEVKNLKLTEVAKQNTGHTTYKIQGDVEVGGKVKTVSRFLTSATALSTTNMRLYSYFDPQDVSGNTYFFDTDILNQNIKNKIN